MSVEISVESYLFTCVACGARWTEDYQVRQVVDEGAFRTFYSYHGDPCEAPVSGNVECPSCHAARTRRDPLYSALPELTGLTEPLRPPVPVPAPRPAPSQARRMGAGSWHRFKFSAVVTLEAAGRPGGEYPSGAPGLLVRAPSCQLPARYQYFPVIVYTDDNRPLRPGDKGVSVAMSVPDDDAAAFFQPGQHFALWDGADVGHGTVAQRLVLQWP